MPRYRRAWYFDCVTLSNFAHANALWLIEKRYRRRAFVTTEVLDEIGRGIASGHSILRSIVDVVEAGVLELVTLEVEERRLCIDLLSNLSEGEASTIAAAKKRRGTAVTDDKAARAACDRIGVLYTGTLGILKASAAASQISSAEADELLAVMVSEGFFSPVRKISDLL